MFGRWGRFVYRLRRWVSWRPSLVRASARSRSRRSASRRPELGRLARPHVRVGHGHRAARGRVRGRPQQPDRPLPGDASTDATSPRSRRRSRRRSTASPVTIASPGSSATPRPATGFISTDGDAAYVIVQLDVTRRGGRRPGRRRCAATIVPPAGRPSQLTGYGPLARTRRERQSEEDLQRAETVSLPLALLILIARLRLARRRGHAAARRRPGDPHHARAHLPRRPADRDEHLRAQRRDDARPRPGHRLLAVPGQPLPRGAAPRPHRRARPSSARSRTSGKAVVVLRASRSPSGCRACCFFESPAIVSIGIARRARRRCARSSTRSRSCRPCWACSAARQLAQPARGHRCDPAPPRPADRREPQPERSHRWERLAHWVMARPIAVAGADAGVPAARWACRSCASSRPSLTRPSCPPASRAATPSSRSRTSSRAGETSPIMILADVDGDPTTPENVLAAGAVRGRGRGARRDRPRRGPVLASEPGDRPAADARRDRARSTPPGRPASAGARPAVAAATSAARPSASTRSARSRPPTPDATALIPILRAIDAGDGVTTEVGGAAAPATTSSRRMSERHPVRGRP